MPWLDAAQHLQLALALPWTFELDRMQTKLCGGRQIDFRVIDKHRMRSVQRIRL